MSFLWFYVKIVSREFVEMCKCINNLVNIVYISIWFLFSVSFTKHKRTVIKHIKILQQNGQEIVARTKRVFKRVEVEIYSKYSLQSTFNIL